MNKTKKIILISVIAVIIIALIGGAIWYFTAGKNNNLAPEEEGKLNLQEFYNNLSSKDSYSFKLTLDDKNSSYFAKQSDDKSYYEVTIDGKTSKYLMSDGNTYYIVDDQKAYFTYQNNMTYLNKMEVAFQDLLTMENSSGKEEVDGKEYEYIEYANVANFAIKPFEDLNTKTRLYFKGKDLKYIKTISGENEEILKVEISDKIDNNLFQLPEGYEGN